MKTRIFISLITAALLLVSCQQQEPVETYSIVGCWELTGVATKAATVGSEKVEVYLQFKDGGSFLIRQKIGSNAARYTDFTGTYSYKDGVLSGYYSDGTEWARDYQVTVSELSLTLATDSEKDTYKKIMSIPE